jgi:Cation transporting ATPase, C-terminus
MTFATVALAELVVVFSFRSDQPARRVLRIGYLLAAVASSLGLLGLAVWTPRVGDLVGAVPLGASEVAIVAAFSFLPFIAVEAVKWLVARRSRPVRSSP